MKKDVIIVNDLNKFMAINTNFNVEKAFNHGYWNCYKYTEILEKFLIDNNIPHESVDWYEEVRMKIK